MPDPDLVSLVTQKLVADHRRFRKANPAASPLLALITAKAIDAFAATLTAVIELVLDHRARAAAADGLAQLTQDLGLYADTPPETR